MSNESATTARLSSARALRAALLAGSALQQPLSPVIDRLVTEASQRLEVPGVNVSLLTDRQVTVGGQGPDREPAAKGLETTFEDSICVNALRTDEPLVIPDTRADERVSSIPAVSDGPVRSYLGSRIRTDEGVVAVLCVYDVAPRAWSDADVAVLDELARAVRAELLRLAASGDG